MSKYDPTSAAPAQAPRQFLDRIRLTTPAKLNHSSQQPSHSRDSSNLSYFEPGTSALPNTYAIKSASSPRASAPGPAAGARLRPRQKCASADQGRDRLAVDLAIAASLSEIEMQRKRAEREEAELCQALLESAVLARSAADPLSTGQDSSLTAQAVLAPSPVLSSPHEQGTHAATGQRGDEAVIRKPTPSEEWLSYARLRKDVALWLEGGPPKQPDTKKITSNKMGDDYEREMLELAMRISLEEAAQLKRDRQALSTSASGTSAGLEPSSDPIVQPQARSHEEHTQAIKPRRKSVPTSIFLEDLVPLRRTRSSSEPAAPSRDLHSPTSDRLRDSPVLNQFTPSILVDKGKQLDRSYEVLDEQAWMSGELGRPYLSVDSPHEPAVFTSPTASTPDRLTPQAGPSSRVMGCPSAGQIRTAEASVALQPTICDAPSLSSDSASIEFLSPASEIPFDPLEALTVEAAQPLVSADNAADLEDPLSQFNGRPLSHVSEQSEPESEDTGEQSRLSLRGLVPLPPTVRPLEPDPALRSPSSCIPPSKDRPSPRKTVSFKDARSIGSTAQASMEAPATKSKPKRPTIAALVGSSLTAYAALAASIVSPQQFTPPRTTDPDPGTTPTGAAEDPSPDEVSFGYLTSAPGSLAVESVTVDAPFHHKSSGAFPEEIKLSAITPNRRSFAIETSRWSTLLKFIMIHVTLTSFRQGDVKLSTTSADQMAHDHPAECGVTLTFWTTESGQFVLRLVIVLISIDHSIVFGQAHELNIVTHLTYDPDSTRPTQPKSKTRQVVPTSFFLPDPQLLPTRMSTFSISLFMLRHLAHIAHSTQPAKDASASYYALRSLAAAIQATPSQATQIGNSTKAGTVCAN
ncbi:BQ5605_C001g00595 [Microbotryum silenes-dioicae]|uniref:BQ5605_C001g00595 protein n=1 Tax=Microbotryum silenes-dioicae TaxID=796604 RepID=A0A2X0P688_9BASI|nr:BQ5605_C001g00595 [Microbotryum silenes-dioicae]